MTTLGLQIENIEQYYDNPPADADDELPPCPACDEPLDREGQHLACHNTDCDDLNWYLVENGQLIKIAPAF